MEIDQEYTFIKLDSSRIKDLLFLYKYCFGFEPAEDDILSKHLNCNASEKFIGFIAYTKELFPAAYYGVFPQIISYNNKEYLVAQSGDTMTHPDHQKKGLFIALAKHTFNYCQHINILAIFGFPNQNSYPGFINKLGFKETKRLTGFTFYENRLEFARLFKRSDSRYNKMVVSVMKTIFKEGQPFENSNSKFNLAFVKHDDVYFNSKNKKNILILKIKGADVFIKIYGNTMSIGDINTDDAKQIKAIIGSLKKCCFLLGLRFLNFDATSQSSLISKMMNLNPTPFESNRSILLNLDTNLPFDVVEYLGSDIDVF
jgi:hypothetical protein